MCRHMLRALLALTLFAVPVLAQHSVVLDRPDAVLKAEFTQIRGVRELSDGRVIVSDRLDRGVVAADFAAQSVRAIGRTGAGPGEYRNPTLLFPLPGDSTLLVDEGNSRTAVIGPDLRIHRSFALMPPGFGVAAAPRGMDARGRYYVQSVWWRNPPGTDSLAIVRFDPRTERLDTIARVKGLTRRQSSMTLGLPYVLFAPQDVWAVAPDGRLALARARDYHVEWIAPGSPVVAGPPIAAGKLPVTFADRLAHVRTAAANSPTSGREANAGGHAGVTVQSVDDSLNRAIAERQPYAEVHPPFTSSLPHVTPDGTFWVEQSTPAGSPARWDVFGATGALVLRVQLPAGRTLGAVGVRSLYLVATDEDGVQTLERYRRP